MLNQFYRMISSPYRLIRPVFFSLMMVMASASQAGLPTLDSQGNTLPTLAPMLERVTPAVVNIATEGRVRIRDNPLLQDPFFRYFFDLPQRPRERKTQSLGSGVIVDAKRGYILTNNHVIDKAIQITVTLVDGRKLNAELIGTDPASDVAIIQIPSEDLTAVKLADSEQLRVGDFVVAIGNPFGLGQTVTSGIVSALGRSGLGIEGYEDFIQTDASINPGNSGGALVNLRGELVGINTAILAPSGGNVGIGFAIPTNMAQQIMGQLIEHGEVRRGRLGISVQDLTAELAGAFDIKSQTNGTVIVQIIDDSPADIAGLQIGDIITRINGKKVHGFADLRNVLGLLRVGEKVDIEILRDGKTRRVSATIADTKRKRTRGQDLSELLQGAFFSPVHESSSRSGEKTGILVAEVEPGSIAWRAGLRKDDVIYSINRIRVESIDQMREALGNSQRGILMNIRRGNFATFIVIQ